MFVATSTFTIRSEELTEAVKEAFRHRPRLVDDAPGFLRMDVMSPQEAPDQIILFTYWEDEASFRQWHRSHRFRDSHKWIPKGLKLVPKSVRMSFYEHVTS